MHRYRQYNIKNTDKFQPDDYPKVLTELEEINSEIAGLPAIHKGDIIISYLKDHSLNKTWLSANPAVTELLNSGRFVTANLKSLFECCQVNDQFSEAFEEYIRKNIS